MKKLILGFIFFFGTVIPVYAQLSVEQKKIRKVFFDFLKFYQKNEKQFNTFSLYGGTGKEQGPPYHINWKEANRYFLFLRTKVPYVGEAYINAEKKYFKYYDSCYKADKEEEIVVGFDFDRWAGGQESIDYTIKWYTSPKNIYEVNITGNTAVLRIGALLSWEGGPENDRSWSFVLFVKEKGIWKMADNIMPELDESESSFSE